MYTRAQVTLINLARCALGSAREWKSCSQWNNYGTVCVCVCVCSKQKLGQEQAKYTHNAKSTQEPGSQLELCTSSAAPRLCIVYLYIHVLYVIGSKEDDLPVSRSMYYIFPYFPPFYIFTSLTQCCHLSKEDRRNIVDPPSTRGEALSLS